MMTKLREMTFIFIWILVIAFVGLMVFEWGMDISGIKSRSNIVGKIEGNKITIQDFQKALQNAYLREKNQTGTEPDENRMKQLRDQVWESYIQRVLFAKELKKRHIQITDREIYLQLTENPPQELRQNPNFQTDGQFDMEKYRQALQNPEINWMPIEDYYREVLPFQKLQVIVTTSVMVPEEEIKAEYMEKNLKAKIKYLHIPVSAFKNDSMTVTEEEMKKYYQEHKEDFKVEEKRKLNYVLFPTDPTPEDSAKVYRLAEDLLKDAHSGVDFAQLADEYSEDPSVQKNHGDLGYFDQERMVKEFSDAAFSGKPGDIVGPVKTRFGLHIIKIHDKKVENGVEKVHASHILLKFSPSALTIEEAQNKARNFSEQAKDEGFKVSADKLKYEIKQTPEFPKRNYIPGFGIMSSAIEWTFKADVGDVSRVYRTPQGYVVFELAEILPEGYRPFDEVKDICKTQVEYQKRKKLARTYAERIQEKINQNYSFEKIAAEDENKIVIVDSTGYITMIQTIPKIGVSPEISALAFSLEPGKVSHMVETRRGFYFIKVVDRTEFNEKDYLAKRLEIRNRLLNQKKQKFFNEWFEKLKEDADIEDNRDQFFSS